MRGSTAALLPVMAVLAVLAGLLAPGAARAEGPPQVPASDWISFDAALIHPGVQTVSAGGQCTANFVFTDAAGDVLIGQAAHCSSADGSSQTNGCTATTRGIGIDVEIQGASQPGTLVWTSWDAMQQAREGDRNACAFNDFALVRVHPQDWAVVNPSLPVFGGPVGLVDATAPGDTVHTFGNSSLRPDGGAAKTGQAQGQTGDGWNHDVLTVTNPGIPGDSGSGFLDAEGRGFGVLSTFEAFPNVGSNGVSDLSLALSYLDRRGDLDVTLQLGTVAFSQTGGGADAATATTPRTRVRRLAGPPGTSRVETAVDVGRDDFPADRARTVVIGRADVAADALAASALAVSEDGPLLLTGSRELHPAVVAELARVLRVGDPVTVLGGPSAISERVVDQLTDLGAVVRRLEGGSRVETSIAVAEATRDDPDVIVVADGQTSFTDALIAGPVAASLDGVVVLTGGPRSHPSVDDYLADHPDARVIAIGAGAAAAYPAAEAVTADNPVALSVAVAESFFPQALSHGLARVDVFADALAGGAHIGRVAGPVLLTDPAHLSGAVANLLSARAATTRQVVLYGGPAALSSTVEAQVRAAATG